MPKVLVVGMFDSVHFVKWLAHFEGRSEEFLLFPSSPHRKLHPDLIALMRRAPEQYLMPPILKFSGLTLWLLDLAFRNSLRASLVRRYLASFRPDFVHGLEIQHGGYLIEKALRKYETGRPTVVITNYGSDIFWFQRKRRHRAKISRLLLMTDRYAAECMRDVNLARVLGYRGQVMPVRPNAGGFSKAELEKDFPSGSDRNLIMVKGYHGWVGRAHIALSALEKNAAELRNYEVLVYSCNLSTNLKARQLSRRVGLKVNVLNKRALSHEEMLEKFSNALIYVGLSLSDGISTSMLEAMAMGAIPVQTSSACCDEWFADTGVAIENLNVEDVAQGIQMAINLALTTDSAAVNRETIRARASREEIAKQATAFYKL